jgi:hypothetical protein
MVTAVKLRETGYCCKIYMLVVTAVKYIQICSNAYCFKKYSYRGKIYICSTVTTVKYKDIDVIIILSIRF